MNKVPVNHTVLVCILLFASLATGCLKKSSPVYHYTLDSTTPEQLKPTAADIPTILIGPVRVASFLNQGSIVVRTTENEVSIAEQQRWAGPLPELLSNTLIATISRQLGSDSVFSFPDTADTSGLRVEITVIHFERSVRQTAVMEVRYRILSTVDSSILYARTSRFTLGLQDKSYSTLVSGLNTCINHLGGEISRQILLTSPST